MDEAKTKQLVLDVAERFYQLVYLAMETSSAGHKVCLCPSCRMSMEEALDSLAEHTGTHLDLMRMGLPRCR